MAIPFWLYQPRFRIQQHRREQDNQAIAYLQQFVKPIASNQALLMIIRPSLDTDLTETSPQPLLVGLSVITDKKLVSHSHGKLDTLIVSSPFLLWHDEEGTPACLRLGFQVLGFVPWLMPSALNYVQLQILFHIQIAVLDNKVFNQNRQHDVSLAALKFSKRPSLFVIKTGQHKGIYGPLLLIILRSSFPAKCALVFVLSVHEKHSTIGQNLYFYGHSIRCYIILV